MKSIRKYALWLLLSPFALQFVGAASNHAVLWANNDTFPVRINAVKLHKWTYGRPALSDGTIMLDDVHCVMMDKTHLNWLADNFDFHNSIESVGDLLLDLGVWFYTFVPFVWGVIVIERVTKN